MRDRRLLMPFVIEFVAEYGFRGRTQYIVVNYGRLSLLMGKN